MLKASKRLLQQVLGETFQQKSLEQPQVLDQLKVHHWQKNHQTSTHGVCWEIRKKNFNQIMVKK
jgi:hypothetical protein